MKCPICKQHRSSKLHSDKCSKIAQKTLDDGGASSFVKAYKSQFNFREIPDNEKFTYRLTKRII